MNAVAAWYSATATDTGLRRSRNEDRVYADDAAGVFLVVDGMGGHPSGERAAEIAVQAIPRALESAAGDAGERIRRAIAAANNAIYELSSEDAECRGMACVLTLAIVEGERVTLGHVGDSRLYLAWNGMMRKLTTDHSPVGEQEDNGEISERDAMVHPRRNEVFRDAGTAPHEPDDEDFIEVRSFLFHPDAAILLCTDGLSDAVTTAEINAIIERYDGDPARTAQMLVDAANEAGGSDNVSVIFVAGPEFIGAASPRMLEARARHGVTRMRGRRWIGLWLSRFPWLLAGIAAGMASWAAIDRLAPNPAPRRIISIKSGDPGALSRGLAGAHRGDTMQLGAGQYQGPVTVREGVTLLGPKSGAAVIGQQAGPETPGTPAPLAEERKP